MYWAIFIEGLEASWQKPLLRKAEKLNLVITEIVNSINGGNAELYYI